MCEVGAAQLTEADLEPAVVGAAPRGRASLPRSSQGRCRNSAHSTNTAWSWASRTPRCSHACTRPSPLSAHPGPGSQVSQGSRWLLGFHPVQERHWGLVSTCHYTGRQNRSCCCHPLIPRLTKSNTNEWQQNTNPCCATMAIPASLRKWFHRTKKRKNIYSGIISASRICCTIRCHLFNEKIHKS